MSERIKFTVFRDKWLRGIPEGSCLLSDTGSRCCLGHLARDLGATDDFLIRYSAPASSARGGFSGWPQFLLTENGRNSEVAFQLMRVNDLGGLSESEREAELTELFAKAGIDVTFVDGAGP